MRVLKFGGSSLANAKRFIAVADIILKANQSDEISVVLSAPGKTTNQLVDMIENAQQGYHLEEKTQQLQRNFNDLFHQLKLQLPNLQRDIFETVLNQTMTQISAFIQGISLLENCPEKIQAKLISQGEKISIALMQSVLQAKGALVDTIDPVIFLLAKGRYTEALIDINASSLRFQQNPLTSGYIHLMAGFTAGNKKGELVTLGRNGSDYSAAALSACLRASACEIWTDVDGVYNCDPRIVADAHLLDALSYQEAMELSYFGASVLHPKTIAPIAQFQIPCLIKNTFSPNAPGTLIGVSCADLSLKSRLASDQDINDSFDSTRFVTNSTAIKGISTLSQLTMVNISGPGMKGMVGMASRIFNTMSNAGVSLILITQSSSEYSISFCIEALDKVKALTALNEHFDLELKNAQLDPIDCIDKVAIVTLVGDQMKTARGVASRFFASLAQVNANVMAIAQGSSERAISAVISEDKISMAVKACHENLFHSKHYLDVFLMGVGGVGAALLEQFKRQQAKLQTKGIELRVCGLINSKSMMLDANGLCLSNWQAQLNESTQSFDFDKMKDLVDLNHIVNPVFIDCTSNETIANQYPAFLSAGFHVVTPNKKSNTSSIAYYQKIRQTAQVSQRKFLYDTTVGAGLPVIENLQNLISAGDELEAFHGILSGSLSYIFGCLDEGLTFSQATLQAKENGFTEPDPRDDLSGMDVARKLLILAREAGMEIELEDVLIESPFPKSFDSKGSIDSFLNRLPELDAHFRSLIDLAKKERKVLRHVGKIENGQCKVSVQAVDEHDPMYKIKNGENALAFYSRYYQPIPLVLRGYGAGCEVTAAGIFADVMRTLGCRLAM